MMELTRQQRKLPEYVKIEEAMPGYCEMLPESQTYYTNLYLLAVYPELLRSEAARDDQGVDPSKLPQKIEDLQALVYFIFQYNLSNLWIEGERFSLIAFIPIQWTLETGLRMEATSGDYPSLLENLSELQSSSISLYFSIVVLSLVLSRASDCSARNYYLLMTLLADLLDGKYDYTKKNVLESQKSALEEPWLINYLPIQVGIEVDPNDTIVSGVREYLLGSLAKQGLFSPPEAPQVASVEADLSHSKSRRMCIIL